MTAAAMMVMVAIGVVPRIVDVPIAPRPPCATRTGAAVAFISLGALVGLAGTAGRIILRARHDRNGRNAENKAGSDNQRLHRDSSPH